MPASSHQGRIALGLSLAALIFLAFPNRGSAQNSDAFAQPAGTRLALSQRLGIGNVVVDSTGTSTSQVADTLKNTQEHKSPLAAVLFSIIPGGGQIYNGSYWKVPIVWGVQAYFVYEWIINDKAYLAAQHELSDSIAAGTPYSAPQSAPPSYRSVGALIERRNNDLGQRDSYAWYIAGAYLLSMLDAYVDAELSGFNVSTNLSASHSVHYGNTLAVSFRMRF